MSSQTFIIVTTALFAGIITLQQLTISKLNKAKDKLQQEHSITAIFDSLNDCKNIELSGIFKAGKDEPVSAMITVCGAKSMDVDFYSDKGDIKSSWDMIATKHMWLLSTGHPPREFDNKGKIIDKQCEHKEEENGAKLL